MALRSFYRVPVFRQELWILPFKEARSSFFAFWVYLLKSRDLVKDRLRFLWHCNIFSTDDQSLFSRPFSSNTCYHSNGNARPLFFKAKLSSQWSLCEGPRRLRGAGGSGDEKGRTLRELSIDPILVIRINGITSRFFSGSKFGKIFIWNFVGKWCWRSFLYSDNTKILWWATFRSKHLYSYSGYKANRTQPKYSLDGRWNFKGRAYKLCSNTTS